MGSESGDAFTSPIVATSSEVSFRRVFLVTGSSGRLGSALFEHLARTSSSACGDERTSLSGASQKTRRQEEKSVEVIGMDPKPGRFTSCSPDDADSLFEQRLDVSGTRLVVFHAGALHKPNVSTHSQEEFVQKNILFTAHLIALCTGLKHATLEKVIFTSTTSVFGSSFSSSGEVAWVDHTTVPPAFAKNIYGMTKIACEQLMSLAANKEKGGEVRFVVLRACRFFPEEDDRETHHDDLDEDNLKLLHVFNGRRLLTADVVGAHVAALETRFERFECLNLGNRIALQNSDRASLEHSADKVLLERYPFVQRVLEKQNWKLPRRIDRVYDASRTFSILKNWTLSGTPEAICSSIERGEQVQW